LFQRCESSTLLLVEHVFSHPSGESVMRRQLIGQFSIFSLRHCCLLRQQVVIGLVIFITVFIVAWIAWRYCEERPIPEILDIAYSPDGELLAAALSSRDRGGRGHIRIWDTTSWQQVQILAESNKIPIAAIGFSQSGGELFGICDGPLRRKNGYWDGSTLTKWEVSQGRIMLRLSLPNVRVVDSIQLAATGRVLGLSTRYRDGYLVNCDGGEVVRLPSISEASEEHWIIASPRSMIITSDALLGLMISRDSHRCASINLSTMAIRHSYSVYPHHIISIVRSSNNQLLAASTNEGTVFIWDLLAGTLVSRWQAVRPPGRINGISFFHHRRRLITAGSDGSIQLWNVDGTSVSPVHFVLPSIHVMALSPDDQSVVLGVNSIDGEHTLIVIRIDSWTPIVRFDPLKQRA
jgi:WD40 repeat protein